MKCYIPLQTPTESEVNSLHRFNLTSLDGTWYPSSSKFEVSEPDPFNSNLSQYSDFNRNKDLYSIQSHPVVEDEFLSSVTVWCDHPRKVGRPILTNKKSMVTNIQQVILNVDAYGAMSTWGFHALDAQHWNDLLNTL